MARDFSENTIINERYRLKRKIGEGGFSEVWLAEDTFTDTEVAVKIYAPDKGLDKDGLAQFKKEYRRTRGLRHPYLLVPDHFDILSGTSSPLLVLPYCSNGSLSERLNEEGVYDEPELARLLAQICSGLAALHRKKIIHQDIKPGNVLIDENDRYQLTDFGISRQMRSTLHKATASQSYLTVAYSPPERYIANPVDTPASDIFSLGVMAYELCTGSVPWDGMGGMVLNSGAQVPKLPEQFSNRLNIILQACMNKEYRQRPTAVQLKQLAEAYLKEGAWPDLPSSVSNRGIESERADSDTRKTQKMDPDQLHRNLDEEQTEEPDKEAITADSMVGTKFSRNLSISVIAVFTGILLLLFYFSIISDKAYEKGFDKAIVSYTKELDYANAFTQMKKLADEGYVPAYYFVGRMYQLGQGVNKNKLSARFYYQQAIEAGDAKAYYGLGHLAIEEGNESEEFFALSYGSIRERAEAGDIFWIARFGYLIAYTDCCEGTPNLEKGFSYYMKAAEQGYALAQNSIGWMYQYGEGTAQNYGEAIEWYKIAAVQGYKYAQNNLGFMNDTGQGIPEDDKKANSWYLKAANQGNAVAQYNLGSQYYSGEGVPKNYDEALKWYKKAGEQGHSGAQNYLGIMYQEGKGVSQNDGEAFKWYKKSAEQGNMYAQYNLGDMYYDGEGVPQNFAEAFKWYKKAAERGYVWAQNRVGYMFDTGEGVTQSHKTAFYWYRKAATQGLAVGQYNLGVMYYNGEGVTKNYSKAKFWFQKAAANGYDDAKKVLMEKF